jgi:hypothetical protein
MNFFKLKLKKKTKSFISHKIRFEILKNSKGIKNIFSASLFDFYLLLHALKIGIMRFSWGLFMSDV